MPDRPAKFLRKILFQRLITILNIHEYVFCAPDALAAIGINPGAELFLHQSKPAYVVRLGETELALDQEIATEIFVKPLD